MGATDLHHLEETILYTYSVHVCVVSVTSDSIVSISNNAICDYSPIAYWYIPPSAHSIVVLDVPVIKLHTVGQVLNARLFWLRIASFYAS